MSRVTIVCRFAFVLAIAAGSAAAGSTPAGAAETPALPASTPPVAATPDPRGMNEVEREAYAKLLREAQALLDRKQYAEAIAMLDKLVAQHPHEPQAAFIRGVALTDAGKPAEAIDAFRALVAEFPELPEPRNNLAVLYAKRGEYPEARDELERAVRAAPDYAIAHENLGDVYARLAQLEYERTVALDKRNHTAPLKLKLVREAQVAGR